MIAGIRPGKCRNPELCFDRCRSLIARVGAAKREVWHVAKSDHRRRDTGDDPRKYRACQWSFPSDRRHERCGSAFVARELIGKFLERVERPGRAVNQRIDGRIYERRVGELRAVGSRSGRGSRWHTCKLRTIQQSCLRGSLENPPPSGFVDIQSHQRSAWRRIDVAPHLPLNHTAGEGHRIRGPCPPRISKRNKRPSGWIGGKSDGNRSGGRIDGVALQRDRCEVRRFHKIDHRTNAAANRATERREKNFCVSGERALAPDSALLDQKINVAVHTLRDCQI